MAQVPNYYYNSPWIADAARNLASALAPPDPKELLDRERAEWEFNRKQRIATLEDQQLADKETAESAFARMLRPTINPQTGEVDQELTNRSLVEAWAEAVEHGGDPATGAKLAGTMNPDFAVREALANIRGSQNINAINTRGAIQEEIARLNWNQRGILQNDAQVHDLEKQKRQQEFQSEQNFLAAREHMARIFAAEEAKARAGGGGVPKSPPDGIIKEISYGLDDMIAATNRTMTLEARNEFIARATRRWQKSGNWRDALNVQWRKSFPKSNTFADAEHDRDVPGGFFGGGSRGALRPVFEDETEPAPTPYSQTRYGDVITQISAPPAPVQAPPPAAPEQKPTAKPPRVPRATGGGKVPTKTIKGETRPAPRSREERDSLPAGTPYWGPNGEDLTVKGR
jgi:hypothetical protein